MLSEMDVIIGPIANDTIYDTLGITTSGFLDRDDALKLFLIGPLYEQVVIKTEQGRAQLNWLSADRLESSEIIKYREIVQKEEQDYQTLFAKCLERM